MLPSMLAPFRLDPFTESVSFLFSYLGLSFNSPSEANPELSPIIHRINAFDTIKRHFNLDRISPPLSLINFPSH